MNQLFQQQYSTNECPPSYYDIERIPKESVIKSDGTYFFIEIFVFEIFFFNF